MWVSKNQCHYLGVMQACGHHIPLDGWRQIVFYLPLVDRQQYSITTLCCQSLCVGVLFSRENVEYCNDNTHTCVRATMLQAH